MDTWRLHRFQVEPESLIHIGFPLLIIGTSARNYIHFSQIQGLYDEQDLGQACSFSLLTSQAEYRFFSDTSLGYQKYYFY